MSFLNDDVFICVSGLPSPRAAARGLGGKFHSMERSKYFSARRYFRAHVSQIQSLPRLDLFLADAGFAQQVGIARPHTQNELAIGDNPFQTEAAVLVGVDRLPLPL